MNAKQLREERGKLAHDIKALAEKANEENRDFNAEEQETWDKINSRFDELTKLVERAERVELVTSNDKPPVMPGRDDYHGKAVRANNEEDIRALALQGWCLRQAGKRLSDKHYDACEMSGLDCNTREYTFQLAEQAPKNEAECRSLSLTTGSAGGYTVPTELITKLERSLLYFSELRQNVSVTRLDHMRPIDWPTANDTSNVGELLAEGNATNSSTDPTFAKVSFQPYTFSSKLIRVPFTLLQSNAINLVDYLGTELGRRVAEVENTYATTGTGTNQPHGYITASSAGKTAASQTAVTIDEIMDLVASVNVNYRSNGSFAMNDAIKWVVRKLKDGNGQYYWQPGVVSGEPDRLLGYRIITNNAASSAMTTGQKIMAFGDFSKVKFVEFNEFRLRRLDERYAEYDEVGFVLFHYFDSDVLDAGTDPIKHLILA